MSLTPTQKDELQARLRKTIEGQWLSEMECRKIRARLGVTNFDEFAYQTLLVSEKPSKLRAAADAVKIDRPAADTSMPGLILSLDVLHAFGKAQGYLDRLRRAVRAQARRQREAITSFIEQIDDDKNHEFHNLLDTIEAFTPRIQDSLARYCGHAYLANILESAAQGRLVPLWLLVGEIGTGDLPLQDAVAIGVQELKKIINRDFTWESFDKSKLIFLTSAFGQADTFLRLRWPRQADADEAMPLWISRLGAVTAPSVRVDGLIALDIGSDTNPTELDLLYDEIVVALKQKVKDPWALKHQELADFFFLATQINETVRVAVNDEGLVNSLTAGKFNPPEDTAHCTETVSLTLPGRATPVAIELHYLRPPRNPHQSSVLLKLVAQANTRRLSRWFKKQSVTFGSRVKVTDRRYGRTQTWQGQLWGFDPAGNLRILNSNGVIGIYPERVWDPHSQKTIPLEVDYVGPPEKDSQLLKVATSVTEGWQGKTLSLKNLVLKDPDQELSDAQYSAKVRENLQGLMTLAVAQDKYPVAEGQAPRYSIARYIESIKKMGFRSFIVGGAVRDTLLGKNPNDVDLSTTMPALDLMAHLIEEKLGEEKKAGGSGNAPEIRKKLPFSILQVEPDYNDGIDIVCLHDIANYGASLNLTFDALARDFTFNAVYFDPDTNKLIDPTGMGLRDLFENQLHFVPAKDEASLQALLLDDPVNIARWIKFRLRGFSDGKDWYIRIIRECLKTMTPLDLGTQYRFIQRMGETPQVVYEQAGQWGLQAELKWIKAVEY